MVQSNQDRIQKVAELAAPVARVWRALTDHEEFGQWFHVRLDAPFVVGERTTAFKRALNRPTSASVLARDVHPPLTRANVDRASADLWVLWFRWPFSLSCFHGLSFSVSRV